MLVDMSLGEEEKLRRLRESKHYKAANFFDNYHEQLSIAGNIMETAKIYILDNYEKIEDWSELDVDIYGYTEDRKPIRFGLKRAERERRKALLPPPEPKPMSEKMQKFMKLVSPVKSRRSPRIEKRLQELDDETTQVEKVHNVCYDWSDGDFSLDINDRHFMWLNSGNSGVIISRADYIESKLNPESLT